MLLALDTETTGLRPEDGHRLVEIGLCEISDRPDAFAFHSLINPDRPIPAEATAIHQISDAAVADAPRFADLADTLADILAGATVVIHNAAFDISFLDAAFAEAARALPRMTVICSYEAARAEFPDSRHSLNALCQRFDVATDTRTRHGALIDAQLLAQVWRRWKAQGTLLLTPGDRPALHAAPPAPAAATADPIAPTGELPKLSTRLLDF